jgi:hypothetical protein
MGPCSRRTRCSHSLCCACQGPDSSLGSHFCEDVCPVCKLYQTSSSRGQCINLIMQHSSQAKPLWRGVGCCPCVRFSAGALSLMGFMWCEVNAFRVLAAAVLCTVPGRVAGVCVQCPPVWAQSSGKAGSLYAHRGGAALVMQLSVHACLLACF